MEGSNLWALKKFALLLAITFQGSWNTAEGSAETHEFSVHENEKGIALRKTRAVKRVPGCPDNWSTFGGKCYKMFGDRISTVTQDWATANEKCQEMGATLLSVHDGVEQDFVTKLMMANGGYVFAWTGLREMNSSGYREFFWSDDSPFDYSRWNQSQPNDDWKNGKEQCGALVYGLNWGNWIQAECGMRRSYICHIPRAILCSEDPCKNGALCTEDGVNGGFQCVCDHGYKGLQCKEKTLCSEDTCENGGNCTQDGINGVFRCTCEHGYKGPTCEEVISCGDDTCKNGGRCTPDGVNNIFRCTCEHGYEGLTCERISNAPDLKKIAIPVFFILGIALLITFLVVRKLRRHQNDLQLHVNYRNQHMLDSQDPNENYCDENILLEEGVQQYPLITNNDSD